MAEPYILFVQHGWADTNQWMMARAEQVACSEDAQIVAPCLNYSMT
jgi:hypothetical protein